MIDKRKFDVKYNYYGYDSADYLGLQLPTVEVFIASVEQVIATKEFIVHPLVLDLNHMDGVYKNLRFKNSLTF